MHLTIEEVFLLCDALRWCKKHVSTELKNAYPLLRKQTSCIEKTLIVKSVARRKQTTSKGIFNFCMSFRRAGSAFFNPWVVETSEVGLEFTLRIIFICLYVRLYC